METTLYNCRCSTTKVSASTATISILDVTDDGTFSLPGMADTANGAHCVTVDDQGNAWVCDPDQGQRLLVRDPFQASNPSEPGVQP